MIYPQAEMRAEEHRQDFGEVHVHETGLPHVCQGSPFGDLGDRILISTDLHEVSRKVENRALDLAIERRATLLVAVIGETTNTLDPRSTSRLDELVAEAMDNGIAVVTRAEVGHPVEVLTRLADELNATGIIVGDDQWRNMLAPHPCICAPLIQQATRPVLVLHRAAPPCGVAGCTELAADGSGAPTSR